MLAWGCSHLKTSLSWIFRLTYTYGRHQMLAVGRLSTVAIFRGLGSQGMDARSQGGACQAQGSRGPDASNKVKVSYELTLKVHTYDFSNILLTKLVTQDSPDLKGGKLYYLWSSDIVSKAFSKDFFFFFKDDPSLCFSITVFTFFLRKRHPCKRTFRSLSFSVSLILIWNLRAGFLKCYLVSKSLGRFVKA